jgi:hypothetical protein
MLSSANCPGSVMISIQIGYGVRVNYVRRYRWQTTADKCELSAVDKHFRERSAELQIQPRTSGLRSPRTRRRFIHVIDEHINHERSKLVNDQVFTGFLQDRYTLGVAFTFSRASGWFWEKYGDRYLFTLKSVQLLHRNPSPGADRPSGRQHLIYLRGHPELRPSAWPLR